jgi:hypothetical protein
MIDVNAIVLSRPTETLQRQHLQHSSNDSQPASPTNKKNNKKIKWSQLTKLNN